MGVMAAAVGFAGAGEAFADEALRARAAEVMAKAATFYRTEAASHGGYVYYYSEDLSVRKGEGLATREQIWVQPPGTPTVGMAFLEVHEATDAPFYLDAAVSAAEALVYGQLRSGGWTNLVDFDPAGERRGDYRNGKGSPKGKDFSTLDDGISQAAIRLMMRVDRALEFADGEIHEAAGFALDALLKAQFSNGGFPQGWDDVPAAGKPAGSARYPEYDWRTEGRIKEYWDLYTLNDGVAGTVAETLIEAHAIYGEERFEEALRRLGDFLLLAQMPEPQPAWAQQYNYEMIPVWARKFEPPAIAARESEDAMETLMRIATVTREAKYLAPIPSTTSARWASPKRCSSPPAPRSPAPPPTREGPTASPPACTPPRPPSSSPSASPKTSSGSATRSPTSPRPAASSRAI